MSDSVGLDEASGGGQGEASGGGSGPGGGRRKRRGALRPLSANLKIVIALFLCFMLVVSDVFTSSIVAGFRGAVHCRAPTVWGTVIQALFLIIFMVLVVHLVDAGII